MNSTDSDSLPLDHEAFPSVAGHDPAALIHAAVEATQPSSVRTPPGQWEPPLPEDVSAMLTGYTVTGILGRGGMGAVYRGLQLSLDREVAIKLLPPELGADAEFEARFRREAKAMARLNHPNIVQIHDFGQTGAGHHYFVMEYIDGIDLHRLIHQGELDVEGALNAISQICDALDYAHGEGFVHRDIKPANIFLNRKGILKVGDFGLAKLVEGDAPPLLATEQFVGLTMTGVAMGTPHYIAPEQLTEGGRVDRRADIYSLGVMFYEMLTGEIPRGAVKPPSQKVRGKALDVRIDGVVFKAMESDPAERYQSASELRSDVDVIRTTPLPVESVVSPTGRRREKTPASGRQPKTTILVGLGLTAAVAVGLAVVFATRPGNTEVEVDHDSTEQSVTAKSAGVPPTEPESSAAIPPVASAGRTAEPEPTPPAPKPDAAPTENVAMMSRTKEAVGTSTPRSQSAVVASTENSEEPKPESIGQTPDASPAEDTNEMPIPREAPASDATNPLAAIPGLKPRLDAYLTSRNRQIGDLATKYLQALETKLAQAADGRDLALATAFRDEKARVEALQTSVAQKVADPVAAVESSVALSPLPEGSPEALTALRGVWDGEHAKIRSDLEAKLAQSLQVLEGELTQSLKLDEAQAVLSWREGFVESPVDKAADLGAKTPAATGTRTMTSGKSDPARATKEQPFENTLAMKFVPVPITGGPTDRQRVLFSIWETRVQDFEAFVKETSYSWAKIPDLGQEPDHAVICVSWDDAQAFCTWLTERERKKRKLSAAQVYRLPSDHEWSCAVGIGSLEDAARPPKKKNEELEDIFPWGGDWPPPPNSGNYSSEELRPLLTGGKYGYVKGEVPGYRDGQALVGPVGSYPANPLGLFDLGGNVWEWCEDLFDSERENGRILRDASWQSHEREVLKASYRRSQPRDNRGFSQGGFRVVLAEVGGVGKE